MGGGGILISVFVKITPVRNNTYENFKFLSYGGGGREEFKAQHFKKKHQFCFIKKASFFNALLFFMVSLKVLF